jgi:hypothetical protein
MQLQVADHAPHAWFSLRGGEDYYLDVNCDQGAVGFSRLIKLTDEEAEEYRALGRVFLDYLAARVAYWPARYRDRDLSSSLQAEVTEAVANFRDR